MNRIRWTASTYAAALAAACLAAAPASAQRASVSGQVVDTHSGQPVAYAAVHVGDTRTTVVADAQGRFTVDHLRAGPRAIWANAPGYSAKMGLVDIPDGPVDVRVEMQGDPVRLAALEVTTSRFDRRSSAFAGSVRVFRQADLAGMWYSNVAQLLESRARVNSAVCPGNSSSGGLSCVYTRGTTAQSRIFVDEAPWQGGQESLIDMHLPSVARVEVYGGGREVRVYTRQFMNWASKRPYVPTPLAL
jgi:Carboxypeptidase regulatory-like domain